GVLATDTNAVPMSKELADANERLIQAKKNLAEMERKGLLPHFPDREAAKRQIASAEKDVADQKARDQAAYKVKQQLDAQRQTVANAPQNMSSLPRRKRSIKHSGGRLDRG